MITDTFFQCLREKRGSFEGSMEGKRRGTGRSLGGSPQGNRGVAQRVYLVMSPEASMGLLLKARHVLWDDEALCELQSLPGRGRLESMGCGAQVHGAGPTFPREPGFRLISPSSPPCPAEAPFLLPRAMTFPCSLGTESLPSSLGDPLPQQGYGPCTLVEDSLYLGS